MANLTDAQAQDLFDQYYKQAQDLDPQSRLTERVLKEVEEVYGTGQNGQPTEPKEEPTPVA